MPAAFWMTAPVYPFKVAGFTEALTVLGALPIAGVAVSHVE